MRGGREGAWGSSRGAGSKAGHCQKPEAICFLGGEGGSFKATKVQIEPSRQLDGAGWRGVYTGNSFLILGLKHIDCVDQSCRELVEPLNKGTHHPSPVVVGDADEHGHVRLVLSLLLEQLRVDRLVLVLEQLKLQHPHFVLPLLLLLVQPLLQLEGQLCLLHKLLLGLAQLRLCGVEVAGLNSLGRRSLTI